MQHHEQSERRFLHSLSLMLARTNSVPLPTQACKMALTLLSHLFRDQRKADASRNAHVVHRMLLLWLGVAQTRQQQR